jgi:hypothetical protein
MQIEGKAWNLIRRDLLMKIAGLKTPGYIWNPINRSFADTLSHITFRRRNSQYSGAIGKTFSFNIRQ